MFSCIRCVLCGVWCVPMVLHKLDIYEKIFNTENLVNEGPERNLNSLASNIVFIHTNL